MTRTSELSTRAAEFAGRADQIAKAYTMARRRGESGLRATDLTEPAPATGHPATHPGSASEASDRTALSDWTRGLAARAAEIAAAHVAARRGSASIGTVPRLPEPPDTLIPVPAAMNENREAELARRATARAVDHVAKRRAAQALPSAFVGSYSVPDEENVVAFRHAAFRPGDDDGGRKTKKKKSS